MKEEENNSKLENNLTPIQKTYKKLLEDLRENKIPDDYEVKELPKHIKMPQPNERVHREPFFHIVYR